MNQQSEYDRQRGLYRREYEHDACGVGMVANLSGEASHEIVTNGLTILKRLMHRGATGNDPETGDGAGLLMRIPHGFFRRALAGMPSDNRLQTSTPEVGSPKSEVKENSDADLGVAMIFGGEGEEEKIEAAVRGEGCEVLAWRDVPTNPDAIGHDARKVMPRIRQVFIWTSDLGPQTSEVSSRKPEVFSFERRLYVIRRQIEKNTSNAYVCSCSSRTIVYKGLLLATQIEKFYPDLSDPDFVSPFAIVHQRYSTNTFPSWELAHPFRAIAHNGEINAIKGNLNALAAREPSLASPVFGEELKKVLPIVHGGQSDSASLDNMFELLVAAGRDAPHAMMMLIPQAWGAKYHMGHDVRAFYEYHSALMEPWDGPAAVAFTDGIGLGAALDRNGLRPARWTLTNGGLFVLASETGVLDIPPEDVARHGRLKPGSILWLDLEKHRLMEDAELKTFYARRRPYRRWVKENHIPVTGLFSEIVPSAAATGTALANDQKRFGYTLEDVELILRPMAETGHEPVGAMGNDASLASLRERAGARSTHLFDYFHQLFAQVTNPPIDPIREELVMSIMTYIGNQANILAETPDHARLVKMTRPVLTDDELKRMRNIPEFPAKTLSMYAGEQETGNGGQGWLKAALDKLAADALQAVKDGAKVLILSDRDALAGERTSDAGHRTSDVLSPKSKSFSCRIPSLLAVAAVNKALTEAGVRPSVGIVVESGEVREVHHFAVLLGFGATAINPWLALETVSQFGRAARPETAPYMAATNYVSAVCKGIMKIMSKMGISTLRSYRSARIFEAVGLGPKIMEEYFGGVVSPVGGLELEDIGQIIDVRRETSDGQRVSRLTSHAQVLSAPSPGGEYRLRKNGEEHLWAPQRLVDFRESVRQNDYARFKKYTDDIDRNSHVTLRSQLEFVDVRHETTDEATRLAPRASRQGDAELEPVDSIVKRFVGGAMSLGSLSPEAHETIALALNGLGTMSNSGEGGENPERFGTDRNSAIKQVASGRFGVTVEYLRSAKDLQIKLAQGAKPGEGGQLPAHKVNEFVARLRHAKPGTTLISPPPHHDIYSIEDLAQLIYDLKCANPEARVSVKLVSEAGVGTIAAGVAKAHADVVVISGFDGGTGAAPLTSMKHAGLPWEPGLAEAHQTLLKNNLRDRVKLQVDGQLRTGRDIVIAAMLGADEFAFGTSMLVSLGCVQCRNCNLNCCPVGIATQKEELRAKFAGKPEHLQSYFRFLAEEVRETLASLGLRSLAEARGRADLLRTKEGSSFDFGEMLARTSDLGLQTSAAEVESLKSEASWLKNYDARELIPAVERGETTLARSISNCDRSVGAALSGWCVANPSADGRTVSVRFAGVAGQSFGAFLAKGITFDLRGEANDYVGKSLSGGVITIAPPSCTRAAAGATAPFSPEGNVIAGNVIAYGATSGEIYINGQAGERFGIRNSGATLVVEGVGDHGCEYMTGGAAVILGPVGVNFAAGMTGGVAYVYDEAATLDLNCNLDSVDLFPVEECSEDEKALLSILGKHIERSGSPKARRIVDAWPNARPMFTKVVPVAVPTPTC
ncbi:MAG: glutamate synthase large subunit [Kiritimatiellae bacterium]|nr:glutamate synthase large subunit [Kiritimatiellia bacterium]